MINAADFLMDVYNNLETREVANIFKIYMEGLHARKVNQRRKDNSNTYLIDGKDTSWNRTECYYYKENDTEFGHEDLRFVLRKRHGRYLIVARNGVRAFEISYGHVTEHDKELLAEIARDHGALFIMLREDAVRKND